MCNVGGQRRGFFFFAVVGCALLTCAPCGTVGFDFIPYGPGKSLDKASPEAVQVFRQGLSSAGSRVKRDGGFGSFEGGESGGLNNLLLLSLLQQMAASSPPAAAAPAPAAGAEAPAASPPAAAAAPSPSLASLLPLLMAMGRGGFGCGDDDANATKMGSPEVTGTIPNKVLSSGAQTNDNSKPARSAEPAASIAPEALLIQLQMNPEKGGPKDQKEKNSASAPGSNSTSFDIQISRN